MRVICQTITRLFDCRLILYLPFCLVLTGCLFTPRWVDHRGVKFYVPPGWANTYEENGSMMISMAEASAYVKIEKVFGDQEFQAKVQQSIDLTRRAYGEKRVRTETITSLGALHGEGTKIVLVGENNSEKEEEEIRFMLNQEEEGGWMISAGCSSGSPSVWHAYKQILESLKFKDQTGGDGR